MKLLKSFGEDDIEMKVVSLLDSITSMVSADTLAVNRDVACESNHRGLSWDLCLPPAFVTCHSDRTPKLVMLGCACLGSKGSLENCYFYSANKITNWFVFLIISFLITKGEHTHSKKIFIRTPVLPWSMVYGHATQNKPDV